MAEETTKNLAQLIEEEEHSLDQFAFLIFIPNPGIQMIQVIVDDGFVRMTMKIDRFLNIIETVCGHKERKRIELKCSEYGTPFYYDRAKQLLKQIQEVPEPQKLTAKKLKEDNEMDKEEEQKKESFDDKFESLRDAHFALIDKLHFGTKKKSGFINYNQKEKVRYY